jgi:hypothetical protein
LKRRGQIKRYSFLLFIILFNFVSCGIRANSDTFNNIFVGDWRLTRVDCYRNGINYETYLLNQDVNILVQFSFENKTFVYTATDGNLCNLNMNGQYSTDYSTQTEGTARLFNMVGTSTCNIVLDESGGVANNELVPFALLEIYSNNLFFDFSSNSVEIDFPTTYDGSSTAGFCENACTCKVTMTEV